MECSENFNLQRVGEKFITVCAWSPLKDEYSKKIQEIIKEEGHDIISSHGICDAHADEFRMQANRADVLVRWDQAKKEVQHENAKKIITFPQQNV